MRPLSGQELLYIWENGAQLHPVDRALAILSIACPEIPQEGLPMLSIGRRDALLLEVREHTLGGQLAGFSQCPQCGEKLEFDFHVRDLHTPVNQNAITDGLKEASLHGFEIQVRLPNSHDLAKIVSCDEISEARERLVRLCLIKTVRDGKEVSTDDLPPPALDDAIQLMEEWDPQADVRLDLICPSCSHRWQDVFDIASFFWQEICNLAKRLLFEVHLLAQAYGWREADILSMSPSRRKMYLDMVN